MSTDASFSVVWERSRVCDALGTFPRAELGSCPTPLVPLDRLSREIGRRILLKRDDVLGPAGGGNKTRKLEFLLDLIAAGSVDREEPIIFWHTGGIPALFAR